ncbi:enhanced serine sensitivity protein SseB [Streptomyces sp. SID3343]|uniref:enhanced serine sensitivity protein SseB n=1 Tax=Streptomyces sp. SID3343 TaxID=2690260 RepID=UPI00136BF03D|nr:enhanced serine sensitivity protein SseB [Streptomyces sp. SID3343]MYV99522.1 enhanced serine sensitivity protein SseB [Streptomyces sp. SID3343]
MPFPANPVESALVAAMRDPSRAEALFEALAAGDVWVPLPAGGSREDHELTLPTTWIDGGPYVPVFSSEEEFRRLAGPMECTVAPLREFARGLPPEVGIAINPGGEVGIPIPPPGVLELARTSGSGRGARVRLYEPPEEPMDFLIAAAAEFTHVPVVLSARRGLGVVENDPPCLFIGVELDRWQEEDRLAALGALERALGRAASPWPVNVVLLDVAQDPVGDWMLGQTQPFYLRVDQR